MALSFGASVSALQVSAIRHDITAHDVANVNTGGFRQYVPDQADISPEGVRLASVARVPKQSPTLSSTDLAEESVEQIRNKGAFAANAHVIKAKDRMIGVLIDLLA